jgi:hypothetical protein
MLQRYVARDTNDKGPLRAFVVINELPRFVFDRLAMTEKKIAVEDIRERGETQVRFAKQKAVIAWIW